MKKKLFTTLLAVLFGCTALMAQQEYGLRGPFTPQHELRVSAGAWPLMRSFDPYCNGRFHYTTHRGAMYTSGAWSISYQYRIKKWLDVGGYLSYWGKWGSTSSNFNDALLSRDRLNRISVVPVVRFTWLNKPLVRLYSSAGLGVVFGWYSGNFDDAAGRPSVTGQFTPIGIAVGKSLFGFAEIGLGSQGTMIMGLGYRFNHKKNEK